MTQRALPNFGAGRLYGTRQDISGATPLEFAVLQGFDLDFSFTTKSLYGTNQFAIFIARGEAKATVKAKSAVMSGLLVNNLFFGQSLAAGQLALQAAEAHVVPATPYEVTVAPPNSGTFVSDQGVSYANGGVPLQVVASSPTVGEYAVNASTGEYTFAAADAAAAVVISYTYTFSSAGQKLVITNEELGTTPYFSAVFRGRDPRSGLYNTLVLDRLTSSKLAISTKTGDYAIPEFDAEIMDDGTGNIGTWSFGDLS
jgi:hypothetical protein